MATVSVVNSQPGPADAVADVLREHGLEVRTAGSAEAALRLAAGEAPDLVISEVDLPGLDGLALCRRLCRDLPGLPVLLLSARGAEADRLDGFAAGAADYLVRPFSLPELAVRVEALLWRRARSGTPAPVAPTPSELMAWGDLRIDLGRREVRRAGREIELARKEFDLLALLASAPGRVFDRETLLARVWGEDASVDGHTVSVHIHALRRKIERTPARPTVLLTVHGISYKFSTDALSD